MNISEVLIELERRGIPLPAAKAVINAGMSKKMSAAEVIKISYLLVEARKLHISAGEAAEIIINGINKERSFRSIKADIREFTQFETRRDEREERSDCNSA